MNDTPMNTLGIPHLNEIFRSILHSATSAPGPQTKHRLQSAIIPIKTLNIVQMLPFGSFKHSNMIICQDINVT